MILQIETATTTCSVALAADGELISFKEINERNIHAEVVTVYINDLIKQQNATYDNIDAIAVSCGPGSYTGLRIGVSTAKGLCFALDKPLIAVNTLEAMAKGVAQRIDLSTDTLLCPMIDARRMEVYTAVYKADGTLVKPTAAEIITDESFADLLSNNKVLFFGDGAAKCIDVLGQNPNALFDTDFSNSARDLTALAQQKFADKEFEDVAYFEPYYLKDFIAGKKANV
ncbi:tRNA (adenosine(37)-N6)-threonylcarbamoyltransferase complex dimerization subunit type 1 TsaB [Mucilaginibacter achroorhodeus]|uniref:tRNA (Adenosine(37)-N6)-threonylcarbamoyltransferase complex dimerization subunit type 1 TsaB n=1 Tax=Mucilaginibacter achroorhodeus TaxID=2599294 RepID=A0A563U709_9SPHI|nr:tRNA (adenosine(37)-N6)-threonylcarbamoyltransferase complex dimerization subunit type 1 TsaB [Mucilaginibacter achroorhodeus]TWR27103.1 tRNA (adenosine(37)-N6)-threonylcarbamoyltransferase complex dimerization subunit type 1 TsaB [Mucilaginibacter achroorhodeus]